MMMVFTCKKKDTKKTTVETAILNIGKGKRTKDYTLLIKTRKEVKKHVETRNTILSIGKGRRIKDYAWRIKDYVLLIKTRKEVENNVETASLSIQKREENHRLNNGNKSTDG